MYIYKERPAPPGPPLCSPAFGVRDIHMGHECVAYGSYMCHLRKHMYEVTYMYKFTCVY